MNSNVVSISESEIKTYSNALNGIKSNLDNEMKSYLTCLETLTNNSLFSGAMIAPIQTEAETARTAQSKLNNAIDNYVEFINTNLSTVQATDTKHASTIGSMEAIDFSKL